MAAPFEPAFGSNEDPHPLTLSRLALTGCPRLLPAQRTASLGRCWHLEAASALALRGERQNGAVRWAPIVRALARREVEAGFVDRDAER